MFLCFHKWKLKNKSHPEDLETLRNPGAFGIKKKIVVYFFTKNKITICFFLWMFYFSKKIKQFISPNHPLLAKTNSFLFYKSNKNYLSFCCFKMIHFVRNPYIFWQKNAGFTKKVNRLKHIFIFASISYLRRIKIQQKAEQIYTKKLLIFRKKR